MALRRIVLRNFVIVSELELDFQGGFTALTGETGAGKSILIDALQLVTGARADAAVIREGESRTDVTAEFDASPSVIPLLHEYGFDEAETLLLRRTVDTAGKSRAWINGSPATVQQLRSVGEQLLDIHGQHAWQSLTKPDTVRGLLDAYGAISTATLRTHWQTWRKAHTALQTAIAVQDSLHNERERLAWQINELEKLNPQVGEWDELQSTHNRLANGQALLDAAQSAVQLLEEEPQHNALDCLNNAVQQLHNVVQWEDGLQEPIDVLSSSIAQVEDAVRTLRTYLRRTELEPERLQELDQRLSLWVSMARRYKRLPEDLPALLAAWRSELADLDTATDLEALQHAEQVARTAYATEARHITAARTQAAASLERAITASMQGLGMQGGCFKVQLEAHASDAEPAPYGWEDVIFLVAGHAGSTPRPVGKVASGGELSRIALAIAVTTSQLGTAQTLIFDEVDSGIGGAVAQTVGQLMQRLGHDRQVLAVTHLPQVAAYGDWHLVVTKQHNTSATEFVAGAQRVTEIARMLGGSGRDSDSLSETSLAHAREMLCKSS